jgi:hypothetical protein
MVVIVTAAIDRHCSQRWLPSPSSTTMIDAVRSIPPLSSTTMIIIDKNQLAKERWVGAITAGQGHRQIHPTAASVDDDRH